MQLKEWKKSIFYMRDKEICQYYCQYWNNIKHLKKYVQMLRNKYINEVMKTW